jgi:hypothetical protein
MGRRLADVSGTLLAEPGTEEVAIHVARGDGALRPGRVRGADRLHPLLRMGVAMDALLLLLSLLAAAYLFYAMVRPERF